MAASETTRVRGTTVAEPAMVRVPEGWFWMGSDHGLDCECPRHRVWVDEIEMGACQVTNREYATFLTATGRKAAPQVFGNPDFSDPEQPVVAVSWFEAVAYCEWLSAATGRQYRLPTEAEWERAARGGVDDKPYPWGDEPPQSRPEYASRWKAGPEPVGRSQPNAYGLYEMCENVHEWCSDWFDASYYLHSPERNPRGPENGSRRASRGGSWRHHVKNSKCHTRSSIPPEFQYADYGFRVCRS
ncbi:MAG: formylglycine-generating enzyme family protein [Acidobacteriia bacterium]|nr:formylglycine-generating enzyme family protein [Terriglobia bacterium]